MSGLLEVVQVLTIALEVRKRRWDVRGGIQVLEMDLKCRKKKHLGVREKKHREFEGPLEMFEVVPECWKYR